MEEQALSEIRADRPSLRWYWDNAEEVVRRVTEASAKVRVFPGLGAETAASDVPDFTATDEEWAALARAIHEMYARWEAEGPSDDLATIEELHEGLRRNPVRMREYRVDE